jgi:NAD(P)-dependent dehydrogenase (short-subunit alcohol dehydrogenase family)
VHFAHLLVEVFGKGLGEAIAHRLNEDGVVVVVVRLVGLGDGLLADAAGHREGADPVGLAALFRRHIIRQTVVGEALLLALLAQVVQHLFTSVRDSSV